MENLPYCIWKENNVSYTEHIIKESLTKTPCFYINSASFIIYYTSACENVVMPSYPLNTCNVEMDISAFSPFSPLTLFGNGCVLLVRIK